MRQSAPKVFKFIAMLIAMNYFAFRVELFDEEYDQNHPNHVSGAALSASSLNWETFDKDNAPQAFVIDAEIRIELLCFCADSFRQEFYIDEPFQLIRDKSPPYLNS